MSRQAISFGTVLAAMKELPPSKQGNSITEFINALELCQADPRLSNRSITVGKLLEPSIPEKFRPIIRYVKGDKRYECSEATLRLRIDSDGERKALI